MRPLAFAIAVFLLLGCTAPQGQTDVPERNASIPSDAMKMSPGTDRYPPILHSAEYEEPVPLEGPINSAGAEDSPFITPDGSDFYFFFTPDVCVPVEKQVLDNVTGIWVSHKAGTGWSEPERVVLQDAGRLALDGCEFVQDDYMLFCSAREGYTGVHWFSAEFEDGRWQGWKNADFDPSYEVGELHVASGGQELYFHSPRNGGKGGLDIWASRKEGGKWQEPENIGIVNSVDNEGWPFVSEDGSELWFTRFYNGTPAIFRSKKANDAWSAPELIVSQFAGEPTLDDEGDLYFTHHYYRDGKMVEADIYVAHRRKG